MSPGERTPLDELREKLIEVAGNNCPPCRTDDVPVRAADGRWWHDLDLNSPGEGFPAECDSHGIHEALYQFDKAQEVKSA